MFTIQLNKLKFFSFHGLHEQEKILGNYFEVNISLSFETKESIKTLEQTIDYAAVYGIIKQRMAIPALLLETLAQDLAQLIHAFDRRINRITVAIEKKNPPLPNIEGSVGVTYNIEF